MREDRPRVADAIEGLIKSHQFWMDPRSLRLANRTKEYVDQVDFVEERRYLCEQLPGAAPVWVAPHICRMLAAAGPSYPLDVPVDPTIVPFASAWVWFAQPLPIPNRRPLRAVYMRAIRTTIDGSRRPSDSVPVSDPSTAHGLWMHVFIGETHEEHVLAGIAALTYDDPGEYLRVFARLRDKLDNYDLYAGQAKATLGYMLALLAFLRQKVVVQEREQIENNGVTKRLRRGGYKGDMAVRVITLRAAEPTGAGTPEGRGGYDHRFMVRGHWRQQVCGKGRAERRATWIDSYIKGDPALPLAEPQWTAYKVAR